jgi:hypothetical protein
MTPCSEIAVICLIWGGIIGAVSGSRLQALGALRAFQSIPKPRLTCYHCKCVVTEPYIHPLGDGQVTCWLHADYFYERFPDRLAVARLKHKDIPNFYGEQS